MKLGSPWKTLVLGLGVFAVGVAGVFVGSILRGSVGRTDAYVIPDPVATTLLKRGMAFPDAAIAGVDGSASTTDLIGAEGAVFLFLDLECPPCATMAEKWQAVVDQGAFPGLRVVAITNQPPDEVAAFRDEHGLGFPIVQDVDGLYLTTWRVQRFPLEVIVGGDRRIRSVSYDSVTPVDLPALADRLEG